MYTNMRQDPHYVCWKNVKEKKREERSALELIAMLLIRSDKEVIGKLEGIERDQKKLQQGYRG